MKRLANLIYLPMLSRNWIVDQRFTRQTGIASNHKCHRIAIEAKARLLVEFLGLVGPGDEVGPERLLGLNPLAERRVGCQDRRGVGLQFFRDLGEDVGHSFSRRRWRWRTGLRLVGRRWAVTICAGLAE